jgi:polyisoprenoid-binding protein YceI
MLGGLGHNHVVSSTAIEGSVEVGDPLSASSVSLDIPLAGLTVDDPALRQAEGERFEGEPSADDIEGTRQNMLGPRLLDASSNDTISLRSTGISGDFPDLDIRVDLDIGGKTQSLVFPATVTADGNTLTINGEREVTHRELGLRPFSAALGTLRVRKELTVKYSIVARRGDDTL